MDGDVHIEQQLAGRASSCRQK